jgi:prefoldin subunit 5
VIEQNITEYNPQLRDMNEMIREETEKINELNADQQTISQSLEMIKHLMAWKTVDFEEMHYGS